MSTNLCLNLEKSDYITWNLQGEPSLSAKDLAGKLLQDAVLFD